MLKRCFKPPILRNSLLIALVVGTLLNGINQGDAFLTAQDVNWLKVSLTYLVPFLVATYSAWRVLSYR